MDTQMSYVTFVDLLLCLTHWHSILQEALRKYPPLGFISRECSKDYKIPGTDVVIEKDTQVIVSLQGLHNDPDLFPDPEVFNPERFSKENKDSIKPYTYMPFGEGRRFCIASRYALTVVKTGLASLLRRFEVCSVDEQTSLKIEPPDTV